MITNNHIEILSAYISINGISHTVEDVIKRWNEPHRFYHNQNHLNDLLKKIDNLNLSTNSEIYVILVLVAFYHDVIYNPLKNDNEEASAEFFRDGKDTMTKVAFEVYKCILDTKEHVPHSDISKIFIDLDLSKMVHGNLGDLVEDGMNIYKEYQFYDYSLFKMGRIQILEKFISLNPLIEHYIKWFETWKPNVAIYPGSFNPLHKGHLNIIEKAEAIFDKVIVAQGINPEKSQSGVLDAIKQVIPYKQVEGFEGFLSDYITKKEETGINCTIVRGIRNGTDLDYEKNTSFFVKKQKPDVKYVYIPCDVEFESISSSAIRSLEKVKEGSGKEYLA